jgi:hypothetical protein
MRMYDRKTGEQFTVYENMSGTFSVPALGQTFCKAELFELFTSDRAECSMVAIGDDLPC